MKTEVDGLSRKDAKKYDWGYPAYFFGIEPAPKGDNAPATEKQAKKKNQPPRAIV